jgi:hypothetical protein
MGLRHFFKSGYLKAAFVDVLGGDEHSDELFETCKVTDGRATYQGDQVLHHMDVVGPTAVEKINGHFCSKINRSICSKIKFVQ